MNDDFKKLIIGMVLAWSCSAQALELKGLSASDIAELEYQARLSSQVHREDGLSGKQNGGQANRGARQGGAMKGRKQHGSTQRGYGQGYENRMRQRYQEQSAYHDAQRQHSGRGRRGRGFGASMP